MTIKIGILNVTGYAGSELVRILHRHPHVEITSVTGRSSAGKHLSEVYPHLHETNLIISEEIQGSPDMIFSALPHAASAEKIECFIDEIIKDKNSSILDIGDIKKSSKEPICFILIIISEI